MNSIKLINRLTVFTKPASNSTKPSIPTAIANINILPATDSKGPAKPWKNEANLPFESPFSLDSFSAVAPVTLFSVAIKACFSGLFPAAFSKIESLSSANWFPMSVNRLPTKAKPVPVIAAKLVIPDKSEACFISVLISASFSFSSLSFVNLSSDFSELVISSVFIAINVSATSANSGDKLRRPSSSAWIACNLSA